MNGLHIYHFFNYREYLKVYYEKRKAKEAGFSHRSFLKDAGIPGAVYLQRVLRNERKLMPRYIPNFSKAMGHSPREAEYFQAMVLYGNEKNAVKKECHLKKLLQIRHASEELRFEDKKLKYFEKWYVPVLRELAPLIDFKDDFNLLSAKLIPRISPTQAKNGLKFLVNNGFLKKDGNGRYTPTQQVFTTGDEVNSVILTRYHKKTLSQSIEAFDTIKKQERDISSLTLCVSTDTYYRMKKEIQKFRKRLLAMAESDETPDMVCYSGFQLLPRSKPRQGGKQ
jgi:uncharacterized protein (TIGR02147 family)